MDGFSVRRFPAIAMLAAVGVVCVPAIARAHVGVSPVHDVLHGFEHPFTGLDHLCAMVAVGIWAAQRGGRAIWLVPLTFVSVMTLGGALGASGVNLPFVEPGIVFSLVVLGSLIATATRLPLAASATIVGLFAIVHGFAHGAEIPSAASGVQYALGFVISTILLHAVGIALGLSMQRLHTSQVVRLAGAAIAVCGVWLDIG